MTRGPVEVETHFAISENTPGVIGADQTSGESLIRFSDSESYLEWRLKDVSFAGTGGHLWTSAIYLAKYLFQHRDELLRGKTVIELGCGLALPSFVAANFATRAIATDRCHSILKQVQANWETNCKDVDACRCTLETRQLVIGAAGDLLNLPWCGPDLVVVFSEIVYSMELAKKVPRTLEALLRSPDAFCLAVLPTGIRTGLEDGTFFAELERNNLLWEKVDLDREEMVSGTGTDNSVLCSSLYRIRRAHADTDDVSDTCGDDGGEATAAFLAAMDMLD
eukprot:TRINITY_DN36613_c0_g2_i1.p1 TRINITY_DN36613_c0_g2~~TRINITY_DN36613_c0_g2_i1.p1  ORF type:complete len:279 (+),score=37.96 TRINITY_DN36613_c0_g2_i1:60-896(+)